MGRNCVGVTSVVLGVRSEVSTIRIWLLRVSGGSFYSSRGDDFLMIFGRIYNFWRRWDHHILVASFQVVPSPGYRIHNIGD